MEEQKQTVVTHLPPPYKKPSLQKEPDRVSSLFSPHSYPPLSPPPQQYCREIIGKGEAV